MTRRRRAAGDLSGPPRGAVFTDGWVTPGTYLRSGPIVPRMTLGAAQKRALGICTRDAGCPQIAGHGGDCGAKAVAS